SKIFKTTPASIKYIDGIRSPIRLGAEVFKKGELSEKKLKELIHTLKKYQVKFIKDGVDQYEIVATSALRNTSNSEEARRYIENKIEHPIRIISGLEEAQLISFHPKAQQEKNKMYVDVGGGSTEIYIYKNSNHSFQSFQLGGVRLMLKKDDKKEWERMDKWLSQFSDIKEIIGVGGNIRAFLNANKSKKMKTDDFLKKYKHLRNLKIEEKINEFGFANDRADVIDFALKIYEKIIKKLDIKTIQSTKWGVSDSIAVKIFHEIYSKKISIYNEK
ncbi:MAG: phosphatase, partial [Euryarchaeota archaeon]|nr:phosphatase [Euryarchaeota archaeon]